MFGLSHGVIAAPWDASQGMTYNSAELLLPVRLKVLCDNVILEDAHLECLSCVSCSDILSRRLISFLTVVKTSGCCTLLSKLKEADSCGNTGLTII